ncbi:hypothetical protein Fcan01_19153 [Folsomia candida]|uniref:Uncharacterized protein n=1 Tax=Folsomia candida TaxID=158441 RepID=A0A226DMJ6_FOLCA|nr:hypothetical protein Fcan01_19153 [Folsomia candida]
MVSIMAVQVAGNRSPFEELYVSKCLFGILILNLTIKIKIEDLTELDQNQDQNLWPKIKDQDIILIFVLDLWDRIPMIWPHIVIPHQVVKSMGCIVRKGSANVGPTWLRWWPNGSSVVEDHPWVISNASCLSSEKTVAKSSCRHSPCYSGILFDLLRSADEVGKFLDNCTITEVTSVGRFKSGTWTKNSIMDHLAGNKTDLALAIFNQPTLSPDVKAAVHFESIVRADELDDRITGMTDSGRAGEIFDKYFLKDGPTLWKKEKQLTAFKPRRVVFWM